jgi:hypothetical protein
MEGMTAKQNKTKHPKEPFNSVSSKRKPGAH